MDMQNVIATLHHINQLPNISMTIREALRAIAFILEDHAAAEIATSVISHVMTPITEQVTAQIVKAMQPHIGELLHTSKTLEHSATTMQLNHASLTTIVDTISNQTDNIAIIHTNIEEKLSHTTESTNLTLDKLKDTLTKITLVSNIQTSIDKILPTIETTQARLNELLDYNKTNNHERTQTNANQPSYSNILKTSPPITLTNAYTPTQTTPAIAHTAVRERQILIQPTGTEPLFDPHFTPEEITLCLETVVNALDNPNKIDTTVKTVLCLHTGSLLLELNSKEATNWICTEDIHTQLITLLNVQGTIKDWQYPILVPFLSINHNITKKEWVDLVERENNLPYNSIVATK